MQLVTRDTFQVDSALRTLSKIIVSFYMSNVSDDVVQCQRAVLEKFVPSDFLVKQTLTGQSHASAIDNFLAESEYDLVVIMDIDCIPLNSWAISALAAGAAQGELAGCVQRANHLDNGGHLYVGPFCMAFTKSLWDQLGRPSFQPTDRGDVGEELTYRCEELKRPIHMIWPSSVEDPVWDLADGHKFGLNTEYEGSFLHTFGIRDPLNHRKFTERCRDIVGTDPNQHANPGRCEIDVEHPIAGLGRSPHGNSHLTGIPSVVAKPSASTNDGGDCGESDKYFWHRYIDRYEEAFTSLGKVENILEFGVAEAASIRWLANRFPHARITGADITAPKLSWPSTDRIEYVQADQGDSRAIKTMFTNFNRRFDLIIDDGSHLPPHQASCLIEAFPFVRPAGLYILEDIHTSHPENPDFRQFNQAATANCLHVLLAMQHLNDCAQPLTKEVISTLTTPGFFSADNLLYLFENLGTIELYRRTSLPLRCWRCGSNAFDYKRLRCQCGVDLYSAADSMSFLLWKIVN